MSSYLPAPASAPSVTIEAGAHGPAGHEAVVRVHLRNLADGPREMVLTLLGLDGDWVPAPVRTGAVAPDRTVTVDMAVRVAAGAPPGTYPFALAVEAHAPGAARASARTLLDATLEVDAPSEVVLTVEPAETRAVRRRRVAVVLSNSGEEPVPLEIATQADRGLRISVPSSVTVPARGSLTLPARLSVARPQIVGHQDRMAFTVTARGRRAPARFRGTLTARPLLGSTGVKVVTVVATLALWAAGMGLGVPWISRQVAAEDQVVAGATASPGEDAGPGGVGDGEGPGGAGGGGAAGDGTADGGAPAEGVRIGGVVTGSEPTGVRVDIAPASVLDLQTVPAAAGTPGGGGGVGGAGGGMLGASVPGVLTAATGAAVVATTEVPAPVGKTPAGALGVTRTEALDAARSTSTLEDGTWAFAGMSPTTNYLITLSKAGYQTQRFLVSGAEAAAAAMETTLVAGAGRLAGTVTGPDGPAGGVAITITDGTTTVTTSTNTTGDVGAWAVDGLSTPATYLVTAAGTGLGAQSTLVTLDAGGRRDVDLTLEGAVTTLTGRITGPDSLGAMGGLGGVTVTATDGTTTRTASTATGALAGTFVLTDLPVPATYTVTVGADGYAAQSRSLELTTAAAGVADFRLGVSSGVVQGTVRTPGGTGLGGVGLTLAGEAGTYKTMNVSDAAGSFRLSGVAPGEYVLEAGLFGHVTGFAPVHVDAGGVATADLVLTPVPDDGLLQTGLIQGRVSDATTNGQITCPPDVASADCVVTVSLSAQDADGTTRTVTARSAPDLEYTIPGTGAAGLFPGLYTLTVSAPGYEPGTVRVQVPMGETVKASPVALFRSPSITGVISARVGTVPAGTCVLVTPEGTGTGAACTVDSGGTCTVTGAGTGARCAAVRPDGSYTIDQLASGTWEVGVRTPAGSEHLPVAAARITLEPGEVRRYDATLERLAHVSLTVLYDRGGSILEPAQGAMVTPVRVGGAALPAMTADATGLAAITHLPAGSYRFEITYTHIGLGTTFTGATPVLTVGNNQEITRQHVLTGGTGYAIDGQVFTNLGAGGTPPVPGLQVTVNGITGYSGLVPVRESVTMTTGADGVFTVVTTGGLDTPGDPVGVMTFVSDQVNVTVRDPQGRFRDRALTGVSIASPALTLEVEPIGRPVTVSVAGVAAADLPNLSFRVDQVPPGAGASRIAVHPTGELYWHDDLAQPYAVVGDYDSGTHIRPGTYTITPVLAGYQAQPQQVVVPTLTGPVAGAVPFDLTLALSKYGQLELAVVQAGSCTITDGMVTGGTCTPVTDPVVTLVDPTQGDVSAQAIAGTNRVNFGQLPGGTYEVYVQAAGHAFTWHTLTLVPAYTGVLTVAVQQLGTIGGTTRSTVGSQVLSGVSVQARHTGGETFTATSDGVGGYRITGTQSRQGLVAGTWTITATAPGYQPFSVDALVDATTPAPTVDIALAPLPVDLYLDVYDPDAGGALVDGLEVVLLQGASRWTGVDLTDPALPGRYSFVAVVPGVYTVSVAGGGYAPLIASITVSATGGEAHVSLSIASRRNTVTGTILGQSGGNAAAPLGGGDVTLDPLPDDDPTTPWMSDTTSTDAGSIPGQFAFYNVPDGDYVLTATHADYGQPAGRGVRVAGGQVFSVDIVLYATARQVTASVTSANGFDLTGVLVRLVPPAGSTEAALAPQPAVRSATDPDVYTTVFNQVPPGTGWTVEASGPSGHVGTHTGTVGTDTAAVTVDELRVRVSASATGSPPPLAVDVRAGDAGGDVITRVTVGVGGGQESLYLRSGTYTLVGTAPSGWTLAPSEITVSGATGPDVGAEFALTAASPDTATTTTLTASAPTIAPGGSVTLTAAVARSGPTVSTGEVTFLRNGVPITAAGNPATVTGGTADLTVTDLGTGVHELTARYSGATGLLPSDSGPVFVLVAAAGATPTTVGLDAAVSDSSVTFTLTSSVAGTVRVHVAGPVSAVLDHPTTGGSITRTWAAPTPGAYTAYAELLPTDPAVHAPSRSALDSFTVAAPTPAATTTTLALTPTTADGTSPVTLTATVAPTTGPGKVSEGTVTFTSVTGSTTSTLAAGVTVDGDGRATITLPAATWAVGTHTIRATFDGSAAHATSFDTRTLTRS